MEPITEKQRMTVQTHKKTSLDNCDDWFWMDVYIYILLYLHSVNVQYIVHVNTAQGHARLLISGASQMFQWRDIVKAGLFARLMPALLYPQVIHQT